MWRLPSGMTKTMRHRMEELGQMPQNTESLSDLRYYILTLFAFITFGCLNEVKLQICFKSASDHFISAASIIKQSFFLLRYVKLKGYQRSTGYIYTVSNI